METLNIFQMPIIGTFTLFAILIVLILFVVKFTPYILTPPRKIFRILNIMKTLTVILPVIAALSSAMLLEQSFSIVPYIYFMMSALSVLYFIELLIREVRVR